MRSRDLFNRGLFGRKPVGSPARREERLALQPTWSREPGFQAAGSIAHLTLYFAIPSPLGHTALRTSTAYRVTVGTMTALHAAAAVGKKAPVQTTPLQTPAPTLAQA
jgi:hypothetical protein